MKTLETGQDKIQKICDKLRHETLEPAKEEARHLIAAAKKKAEEIISEAEEHREKILKKVKEEIEQERSVFHSSLQQAGKQALETLRQEIEHHLFNDQIKTVLDKNLADPKIVAQLINGIVKALEKDGVKVDLTAVIPRTVNPEQVTALLIDEAKIKLKDRPLELGQFSGGVQVKLQGQRMTIDLTDQALKELLATFARKDFRKIIFNH